MANAPVDAEVNMKSVLSVVSEDLARPGAHDQLVLKVEPGSELARPKLLARPSRSRDQRNQLRVVYGPSYYFL